MCAGKFYVEYTDEKDRLHVEEAEDKLVQNTETAIGLMKSVLENVRCFTLFAKRKFSETHVEAGCAARTAAKHLEPAQSPAHLLLYGRGDAQRESGP